MPEQVAVVYALAHLQCDQILHESEFEFQPLSISERSGFPFAPANRGAYNPRSV
jgi:hypothetical protein